MSAINSPKHYNSSPAKCLCGKQIECISVVRHCNFNIGNIIKYLWRHEHKNHLEDLKKAQWYLNDEIKRVENQQHASTIFEQKSRKQSRQTWRASVKLKPRKKAGGGTKRRTNSPRKKP